MMRGRLIFPFLAQIHRLDTAAMAVADPDGAGPRVSSYDPDFKEAVGVDTNEDGTAEHLRIEHPAVRVPCQVEPKTFEHLHMAAAGNAPRSHVALVFHFKDLEQLALVDVPSGEALIRPSDRLGGFYDRAGVLVQQVRTPPGLYVVEARPIGFGLHRPRPRRNLLLVTFASRQLAARRTG